jgi:hypothetical protein
VASPAQPTLSELWDGRAVVELLGPAGTEVTMTVKLEDGRGSGLARSSFRVLVPVAPELWLKIAAPRPRRGETATDGNTPTSRQPHHRRYGKIITIGRLV